MDGDNNSFFGFASFHGSFNLKIAVFLRKDKIWADQQKNNARSIQMMHHLLTWRPSIQRNQARVPIGDDFLALQQDQVLLITVKNLGYQRLGLSNSGTGGENSSFYALDTCSIWISLLYLNSLF